MNQNLLYRLPRMKNLRYDLSHVSEFQYFIFTNGNFIYVATLELYSVEYCAQRDFKFLGVFDKNTSSWKIQLKPYEKFSNFHGCELVFGKNRFVNDFFSYFEKKVIELENEILGLFNDLIQIMAKEFNFTIYYQIYHNDPRTGDFVMMELGGIQNKFPNVIFQSQPQLFMVIDDDKQITSQIYHQTRIFLVSPGPRYTMYEKLYLPFDNMIWILLIVTFFTAFIVILIVNKMSQNKKASIYGKNVQHAGLNVLGTFFGISQPRLPTNFFARTILINFIFFCLVIRTAYQGVLFEFMGQEMRRPTITKISDLWEQNFEVFYLTGTEYLIEQIEGHEKMNLKPVSEMDFAYIYEENVNNDFAKVAFYYNDIITKVSYIIKWPVLKEKDITFFFGLSFPLNHFFYPLTDKVLPWLHSAGIIEHSINFHSDYLQEKADPKIFEPEVLTLSALSYGFYIWLGTLTFSILVFFIEFIKGEIEKNRVIKRKIKFAKVHPVMSFAAAKKWPKMETMRKFYLLKESLN
ncbi:hypothetical protein PVAND_017364 [Polypedilum vanderplanki]|uniref:Ionotropic glutamate receptor C-terminal domain-containing protein n=1 Tax=Polypedilum vanderplanki TaxID=319348 RepID=A0A9J6BI24_POLVA|nr:hypothetical protein PVAND_017364 [Polypedilum vanderplanki]